VSVLPQAPEEEVEVVTSAFTIATAGTSSIWSWNRNAWEDGDRETTEVGTRVGCGSSLRVNPSEATPLLATGISSTIGAEPRATTEAGMGAGTVDHYG